MKEGKLHDGVRGKQKKGTWKMLLQIAAPLAWAQG